MTDSRDDLLQTQCPTVMVPKFGEFEPLFTNGHRFLAAADGLWLELRRPWIYALHQVAEADGVTLPYGKLLGKLEMAFSWDDMTPLIQLFETEARQASPIEHAAWGIWNDRERRLEYRDCLVRKATAGSIIYQRPACAPHEHACIDMHSHGALPAFFSAADDDDDRGEVKISLVLGELDRDDASVESRVCLLGAMTHGID